MSTVSFLAYLVVFGLWFAPGVMAQPCSAVPQGNYAACYTYRTQCHFSLTTNACLNNAPAQCSEFVSDQSGCNASSFNCLYNSGSLCNNAPLNCTNISSQNTCVQRSDCTWNVGTAQCLVFNGTCGTRSTQTSCSAGVCFWDPYLSQCFNTLSEVVSNYSCSTWSNMLLPNTACAFHGCLLDASNMICNPIGAIGLNATSVAATLVASFQNPVAVPNSLTFSVQVWLPNQMRINPSYWTYISVGGGVPGYGSPGQITSSVCNNIGFYNYSAPPPAYLNGVDTAAEQTYFNNWINTQHTFDFPTTGLGLPLYSILGNITARNKTFDSWVQTDPTNNWVVHNISFGMNDIVSKCNSLGATELYTSTNRYYTFPLAVIQRDSNNFFTQTATNFYVQVTSAGTIGSVTSSSKYLPLLYRTEVTTVTSQCPAGQALLKTTYLLEEMNVFNTNYTVGPRNLSDIVATTPASNNSIQNCYGEKPVSMVKLGCSNSVCYTQVTMQSACRVITTDGNAFNNCSAANPADRIADMGAMPYPTALNSVHTFYVYNYQCPLTANATNQWAGCQLTGTSPYGYPDVLAATLTVQVYPQTVLQVAFDVYAGLLSTPFLTDLTQIQTLSQGPNSASVSQDLYNTQLQWNGIFTYVIGILDPALRATSNLTMTVNTLFTIYPTDVNGNIINNGQALYISQVFPYMIYVPKQMLSTCRGSPSFCSNAPATANQTAYDSFSISVITLRTLLPANGYSVTTSYQISAPHAINAVGLGNQDAQHLQAYTKMSTSRNKRRMTLQTVVDGLPTLSNTVTGVTNFTFLINDQTNPSPLPHIVIGPNVTVVLPQTNASSIITGYQVSLQLFVDYSAANIVDPTNTTDLISYALNNIAKAIAITLHIDVNQIINVRVTTTPPINGLSKKPAMKLKAVAVSTPVLYITFVIIPSPLMPNVTALSLAQMLVDPATTPVLAANLYQFHLVFDQSYAPQTVVAFVPVTIWYLDPSATPVVIIVVAPPTHDDSAMYNRNVVTGIIIVVVILALVAFASFYPACMSPSSEHVIVRMQQHTEQQYLEPLVPTDRAKYPYRNDSSKVSLASNQYGKLRVHHARNESSDLFSPKNLSPSDNIEGTTPQMLRRWRRLKN